MKKILWIIITILLWLVMVLLLEYDYRSNEGKFLETFSPLQWFVLILLFWAFTSSINVYVLSQKNKLLDINTNALFIFINEFQLYLCIIPLTNVIIFIGSLFYLLKDILTPLENHPTAEEIFEEELKKKTIQEDSSK